MKVVKASPAEAASRLISMFSHRPSVLFVGAFISSRPPTSLPMALPLKYELVDCMWEAGGKRLASVLGSDPRTLLSTSRFQDVPLELLAEEVLKKTSLSIQDLLGWMGDASPNNNHRVLAALVERQLASVVTTNFDELIERQLPPDRQIGKLHGTLSDPGGMVIRLSQVGRGLVDLPFRKRIAAELDGKSVCFVGYAGRDRDIFPVLAGLSFEQVLWIARPCTSPAECDAIASELEHCDQLRRVSRTFECISVDGDRLFDEIASIIRLPLPPDPKSSFDWSRAMQSRAAPASPDEAAIAMVRILGAAGLWSEAADAYRWLHKHASDRRVRLDALLFESEARFWLGDYTASEVSAKKAATLYRRGGERAGAARALQILGLIKGRSRSVSVRRWAPRYMGGISVLLRGNTSTDAALLIINNYLNLGIWQKNHGELAKSEVTLKRGLHAARQAGDLLAQQKLHSALGILFRRRRQLSLQTAKSASLLRRSAGRHLAIARELASYLGNVAEEVRVLMTQINLELDGTKRVAGALRRARLRLSECEAVARQTPEPEQKARVKEMRGIILTGEGNGKEAVKVLSEALGSLRTNTARASAFKSRAEAFELLGLHDRALDDLREAISIVPEGPDKTEIRLLLDQMTKTSGSL